MTALTQKFSKVNLSLSYDGLTIYPKYKEYEKVAHFVLAGCKKILVNKKEKTPEKVKGEDTFREIQKHPELKYHKTIFSYDPDHYLYHHDEFSPNDSHTHIKFHYLITRNQLLQMLTVLVNYELISEEEKVEYVNSYDLRYSQLKKQVDKLLFSDESDLEADLDHKVNTIIQFIKNCQDNDTLSFLHQYMASISALTFPLTQEDRIIGWQAMNAEGKMAPASIHWARIEKGIMLQMAHNIKEQTGENYEKIAAERSEQLTETHQFFDKKHKKKSKFASKTSSAYRSFHDAEKSKDSNDYEFDAKYEKFFRK